ncbi:low choriolytic enzyme-like isoform X2 [Cebidichthys violaceus]|uniref:low choriolytic enzyme-like isoform X2 n=1 Tax=Cebidichthys violaceus TaxID=271503 RepID=UPI0035C95ADD
MLLLVLAALVLAALVFVQHVASSPLREEREAEEDLLIKVERYMKSNPETLDELMTEKYAILEGDMVLSSDRNAVGSVWPTKEIPYSINPELVDRTADILSAMAMVSEHTCVSFPKRTSESSYLHFKTSRGCASYVGFGGGEQPMFIGPECIVGNIVHEILHALGFHHEHTRMDRDQYITVLFGNIMEGRQRNFQKVPGVTFDLSYDVNSILHYGSGFFSANGFRTIVPNGDVKNMGQRVKMTDTDIQKVRRLYSCVTLCSHLSPDIPETGKESEVMKDTWYDVKNGTSSDQSSSSSSLQQLNSTTRGQNDTS